MPADFYCKQGDSNRSFSQALSYTDGTVPNLGASGVTVAITLRSLRDASALSVTGPVVVTDPINAHVAYTPSAADTATAASYMSTWQVTFGNGTVDTFPADGYNWIEIEPSLTLATQQLVTLDDLKDYLNITATSRERDAKLLRYIYSVTPVIEQITGPIIPKIYDEWFDGGSNRYQVARPPAVGYGTSPIFTIIAASEYRGPIEYPLALIASPVFGSIYSTMAVRDYGTITRRTAGGRTLAFMPGRDQVHVWYQSGQSSVPYNVQEATLELLRINYTNTQQVGSARRTVMDEQEPGPPIGFFVPHKVREMLAPTRRAPSFA